MVTPTIFISTLRFVPKSRERHFFAAIDFLREDLQISVFIFFFFFHNIFFFRGKKYFQVYPEQVHWNVHDTLEQNMTNQSKPDQNQENHKYETKLLRIFVFIE